MARRSTIAAILVASTLALGSLSGTPAASHNAPPSASPFASVDRRSEVPPRPTAPPSDPASFRGEFAGIPLPAVYTTDHPLIVTPGRVFDHLTVDQPVVFITIDDGFFRDPRVLAFFRATHLPASLFLIGHVGAEGEDYFRALVGVGAVVEDHTQHHTRLTKLDLTGQETEICEPVGPFETMFGRRPMFLRPPRGALNGDTATAAASCGLSVVTWNAVLSRGKLSTIGGLKAGDIILIHFRPWIYTDLLFLMRVLHEKGLGVGLLEDFVRVTP